MQALPPRRRSHALALVSQACWAGAPRWATKAVALRARPAARIHTLGLDKSVDLMLRARNPVPWGHAFPRAFVALVVAGLAFGGRPAREKHLTAWPTLLFASRRHGGGAVMAKKAAMRRSKVYQSAVSSALALFPPLRRRGYRAQSGSRLSRATSGELRPSRSRLLRRAVARLHPTRAMGRQNTRA